MHDAGSAARREQDTPGDLGLMRRVAVAMLLVGGVTCLSGVWITQQTQGGARAQGILAAVLLASGLGLLAVRRPTRLLLEGSVLWSTGLLSALIATVDTLGMAPFFYLWPVVFAAYFSSTRVAVACYVWMAVGLAAALVTNEAIDLKVDVFVGTVSSVGLMAALVHSLTRRERLLRAELAAAAETDPLTGLLNRRSLDELIVIRLADAAARQRPVAVAMFDIDHFKRLNDAHGHLAGDRALVRVGAVLRSHSRDDDLTARFGGEEFVVVLPGADVDAARRFACRVAAALATASRTGDDLPISVSVGVTGLVDRGDGPDLLLRRADEALYAAKAAGRGRLAVWNADREHSVELLDGGQLSSGRSTPTS